MKSDKFIWIPRGIILFFSICATSIVVASLATNKWIIDPDFLDFEIYAFFSWISYGASFISKRFVVITYFTINLVGLICFFLYMKYFSYYCWAEKLYEIYFLIFFYIPTMIIISVLYFIFKKKRKQKEILAKS
jgi:hypothetical protein